MGRTSGRARTIYGSAAHEKPIFDPYKDKACLFFSCGSPKNVREVLDVGIKDVLVSYHYLKKNLGTFNKELLPEIREKGGIFMSDSGAFSVINTKGANMTEEMFYKEYWEAYVEEYAEWVYENRANIYVAANMDLDNIVGREAVDEWNEKYFRPLEKYVNICYVVQKDNHNIYGDPYGHSRLTEYFNAFDYIGASSMSVTGLFQDFYNEAMLRRKRVHGFGWTSYRRLCEFPFFSVDSTTWLAASQFGATFMDTGSSFKRVDKAMYLREFYSNRLEEMGLDYDKLLSGRDSFSNNRLALIEWLGFRRDYLSSANTKLITKPIMNYAKF